MIWIGLLLLAAALFFALCNLWAEHTAGISSEKNLDALTAEMAESAASASGEPAIPEPSAPVTAAPRAMAELEVDGFYYIGTLNIPCFDISLPVLSGWSYEKMDISPCRYQGSVRTDDLILCGHNYRRHLGPLSRIQPGDEVIFVDVEEQSIRYTVTQVEILDETAIQEMTQGDWDLTMFTCTLGGNERITVRCDRTPILPDESLEHQPTAQKNQQ